VGVTRRDEIIDKVVKMLRLARGAGTEAEAHTALTLAQKLMYTHEIAEHEVAEPDAAQPIEDMVVDETGRHVDWKEYLAAIVAENFRCAYIISESRSSGVVRLVFVGRREDTAVAAEAYQVGAVVAANLAEDCARARDEPDRPAARASFLTGFLKGLYDRFQENAASTALLVIADPAVMQHASSLTNGGNAQGGELPVSDAGALHEGFASGYSHGSGQRRFRG
jgi:hypothetical protein